LHSNANAVSRQSCKQCRGRVAPATWIDECERVDELVEPFSVHVVRLLPKFTLQDIATAQAEDSEIGDAYRVFSEGLVPTPDELRPFPLESRLLLYNRPEIQLQEDVLVRMRDETVQLVVPVNLRRRLFDLTHSGSLSCASRISQHGSTDENPLLLDWYKP